MNGSIPFFTVSMSFSNIHLSYLALGDSYTVGHNVPNDANYPNQTATLLSLRAPHIIAQTGWTTDELMKKLNESKIIETFSVVSLLVGVNNQFRGRSVLNFREEFGPLVDAAIHFAGGIPEHVVVLSIPDWGATPFGFNNSRSGHVAKDIDLFNNVCKEIAAARGCKYIDVTESTRKHGMMKGFVASDGLHPSGKEYALWAALLAEKIQFMTFP
jgi:lysophospholipase L1-like esterase